MCFASKGLFNRAHAYKAAVQTNMDKGLDPDAGINMGLFTYPALMAADILLFDTGLVPVGQDQTQHVEMAADIAGAVNFNYRQDLLAIPEASVQEHVAVVPGLDGRKMSKSYGNVIPLFCTEKELRKLCMRIVTNSQDVAEPKDPETSQIFLLYKLFASREEQAALASRYRAGGMGWGEAKEELFRAANRELAPLRERYNGIMTDIPALERTLREGAEKARSLAAKTLARLRKATGIAL
jgi:tryptophanyl-tRNA synthetase